MENQIILYNNDDGKVIVSVTYLNETFWLPQKAIAALFGVKISHEEAIDKAVPEYEHFRVKQDKTYLSDLDKEIKKISGKKK